MANTSSADVILEGQRWGKEIEAQNDFMTVTIEAANGDPELLELALKEANSISKRVGKLFMTHNSSILALIAFVPEGHDASAKEWIQSIVHVIGGEALCQSVNGLFKLNNGKTVSHGEGVGFEATATSVSWLRSKGLFPPAQSASNEDDDFIPEW